MMPTATCLVATAQSAARLATPLNGGFGDGAVFEIAKTPRATPASQRRYEVSEPVGELGADPEAGLIADSNGDLFGTTATDGTTGGGTVFEMVKTPVGYSAPITLVNFSDPTTLAKVNVIDGYHPEADLIVDVRGDLFGTTFSDDEDEFGSVFEVKRTAAGYASAPTTLASFNFTGDLAPEGLQPLAGLLADDNGDLFGTTSAGGPEEEGTVFEITNSGFVPAGSVAAPISDGILFQGANGQAAFWGMDGTNVIAGGSLSPNPGPAWKTIGTGDFNDDGLPDLLWQNANGQAAIWDMNGTSLIGGGAVSPNPGPSWKAIGTGDFNKDSHSDILWQNTDGQASIWEMSGNSLVGGGPVSPNPGPSWKAIGTGDFNDDGLSDILFQNTSSGQVSIWEMNENHLIGGGPVSPNPGPSWHAIGTGDFNDDGRSDILFQNANSGQVSIWEMNGNSLIGGGAVSPNPGPSWHAIGSGDFNGDGHSDILFQSTSGQTSIWDMNGTSIIGGGAASANAGPSWKAIGLT